VPNITPNKLFLSNSVLNEVIRLKDAYILPNYMPVTIFVENLTNFREEKVERVKVNQQRHN
jgi:hypothetical protein